VDDFTSADGAHLGPHPRRRRAHGVLPAGDPRDAAGARAAPVDPLAYVRRIPSPPVLTRLFDMVIAALALAIAAPILAIAALAIRLESRGPVIYRQRRVGRDGVPFEMLKLRTMVHGAEHVGAGLAVNEGDSRITRVGAILRRFSLDELPNLVNVLRGEMSIVGPRPTVQVQVDQYTDRQRRRLEVKPGITGWAQVNGRASLPWDARIELDVWYVDHRSHKLDAQILARTIKMLVTGDGLYKGETGGWKPVE
jgi:lipopolysaccharide/colanic/teichoic acid biosynthesis glycosyltransferase